MRPCPPYAAGAIGHRSWPGYGAGRAAERALIETSGITHPRRHSHDENRGNSQKGPAGWRELGQDPHLREVDVSETRMADQMGRAPLDLVVVEFPGDVPGDQLAPALRQLAEHDTIRIIDIAFVRKERDGSITTFEIGERAGEVPYEALDEVVQAVDGLISESDLGEIGDGLSPGTTAGVLLWENTWASDLRRIVSDAGGHVTYAERIPGAVVHAVQAVTA
jgi:hypothetical protein